MSRARKMMLVLSDIAFGDDKTDRQMRHSAKQLAKLREERRREYVRESAML